MNELNYVLTRILEMDRRAARVKLDAEKQLEKTEVETKLAVERLEKDTVLDMEQSLNTYRTAVVTKAEEESNIIQSQARRIGEAMERAYEENKDLLVKEAMQRITAGS